MSLAKLSERLIAQKSVPAINRDQPRGILGDGEVTWRSTETWKASAGPDFRAKIHAIVDLSNSRPADGRVVCVDEFGPLNLQPRKGKSWRPATSPLRLRATYHRYDFGDAHARRTRFIQRQNVLPHQAA